MNKILILLLLSVMCGLGAHAQSMKIAKGDEGVLDAVGALPEVHNMMLHDTSVYWHVSMIVKQKPAEKFKYYWIQVGGLTKDRFAPILNFYVSPDNDSIQFLDTVSGSLLSLNEWRGKRTGK